MNGASYYLIHPKKKSKYSCWSADSLLGCSLFLDLGEGGMSLGNLGNHDLYLCIL